MNAIVPGQPSKLDQYRLEVLPPERAADLWRSMPSHIKPAVFERNLINALMANPALMKFDPRLIFREVSKAAGLGLLLDPLLGEGYIVTAYNYKTKSTEPQLRVGYKGMNKLARQSGNVSNIYVHEVCQLDKVECNTGFPKSIKIEPKLFTDRGPVVGYVAIIVFKDGEFDFEPMSVQECQAIRDRSDAWKAFKDGKIKSTPWSTDEGEMSKKTVLRRLLKRQEQSPEMVRAIQIEDEAEHLSDWIEPIVPAAPRVPSPAEVEQIENDHGSDKYQPGDVVDGDGAPVDPISTGPQPAPPKAKGYTVPDIEKEYDGWFSFVLDKITHMTDGGELETFWNDEVEAQAKHIFPSDMNDLADAYGKQQQKLNADE